MASLTRETTKDLIRDYGASGSDKTTLGTMAANSTTLLLEEPIDFKDNEGIFVPNAGPMSSIATPAAPSVTVGGGPSGTSTYGYQIIALDGLGGGSKASQVGTVTTGPATLGGLGPTGSGAGMDIYRASWLSLTVAGVPFANGGYAIYRTQVPAGSGLKTGFIGIYSYTNAPWLDFGQDIKTPPPGVPATPVASSFGQSLVTQITSGGGAKALTLVNAATTGVSNVRVYHDDTLAVSKAFASGSPVLRVPSGSFGVSKLLAYNVANGTLVGEGSQSIIRYQANYTASIQVTASGVMVRDLAFDGQKTANTLLALKNANAALHDVRVVDTFGRAPLFGGIEATNLLHDEWGQNILLDRNEYTDCEYSYSMEGNIEGLRISGNRAYFTDFNYSGRGISLHNASTTAGYVYPRRFTITGNILHCGNHSGGLVVQGSGAGSICANELLISGGIFAFWLIGAGQNVGQAGAVTFRGNYCEALWAQTGVAVNLTNAVNVGVGGNVLRNFGYAYEAGGYGGPAFPASPDNNLTIDDDTLIGISIGAFCGPIPLGVQARNIAGYNPVGPIAPPASPPVSATPYQNTYGVDIQVYQQAYAAASGVQGSVEVRMGKTDTSMTTLCLARVFASSSKSQSDTLPVLRVPAGWWYEFVATAATLGTTTTIGE